MNMGKSPVQDKAIYLELENDRLLTDLINRYQIEYDAITNPAPAGVWMVRPKDRKPQYRWEDGKDRKGRPKIRTKSISLKEASEWEQRRQARDRKLRLSYAIASLKDIQYNLSH